MDYLLMNKDDKILSFRTKKDVLGTEITETASYSRRRPHGWTDIKHWVTQRNCARHKSHFRPMGKEWGLNTADGFLRLSWALSLNDTLWVKPQTSTARWADVSLYTNQFDDIAARTAFETGLLMLPMPSVSPEFTSEGSYPKCWRREAEGITIYKTGSSGFSNAGLEPYAEFMAAEIAGRMRGVRGIRYDLREYKGRLCTACVLFTDEDTGFVPIYRLFPEDMAHSLEDARKLCRDLGFEREFSDMIVLDAVTFNQDRHLGNFGFLMDNDTFALKAFAPLFDFNCSMLCFAREADLESDAAVSEYFRRNDVGHTLGGDFVAVAQGLMTPERRARMPKEVCLPEHPRYRLPERRMERLNEIFRRNYDCVRNNSGPGFGRAKSTGPVR